MQLLCRLIMTGEYVSKNRFVLFRNRCCCRGLRMPVVIYCSQKGHSALSERGAARAWPFYFTPRSNCLSAMLRHNTSSSVYWFIANTHLRATSSLKQRPSLGLPTPQREAQSLRTFLHVAQHITKPDAQRSVNNVSATIQETWAPAVPFSFYRISPDVAKQR